MGEQRAINEIVVGFVPDGSPGPQPTPTPTPTPTIPFICSTELEITNSTYSVIPNGTYQRVLSTTGGTSFVGGYAVPDNITGENPFVIGPDSVGNTWAVFTLYTGSTEYTIVRLDNPTGTTTERWICVETLGSYVDNTGIEQAASLFSLTDSGGILDGGVYYIPPGTYNLVGASLNLNYVSPCPSVTPTPTVTNTSTPTPTPTPSAIPGFCVGAGFNPSVGGVKIENDGLYVFGAAEFYDLQDVSKVVKLNSTTAQLQAFQPYFPADTTNTITDVIKRSNGSFYFAGTFIEYSGQSRTRLVKVNADLSIDTTFQQRSINAEPYQLYLNESTEELIVAGAFTNYTGNTNLRNLIKVDALTNDILPTFPTNIVNNNVNGLLPDGNGNLFIFGAFTTFTGTAQNRIAKISESDGTLVSGFNIGTGFNGAPTDMVVDSVNNRIYVVGGFTTYSGVSQNRLVCINATTGFIDTSFTNSGFNSGTHSIVQNKFGDLFVLGGFTLYGATGTRQLAKISSGGTIDNTFTTNVGTTSFPFFNNSFGQANAHSMLAVDDNYLYVAAPFTGYKGQPLNSFIRLDFDGNLDTIYNC